MSFYVYQTITKNWDMSHQQVILESKAEVLGFLFVYQRNATDTGFTKQVGHAILHLSKKGAGELSQKIVRGTSSEYFANYYNQSMETVSQALKESNSPFVPPISDKDLRSKSPKEIFQMANTFYYHDTNESHERNALYLYEKAALAGFKIAYWKVGRMYSGADGCPPNNEKAIQFLTKGTQLGVELCWTELANIYENDKNFDRWNYCWKRYFESKTFQNNVVFNELIGFDKLKSNRLYQMFFYIQQIGDNQWKTTFMPIVVRHRSEISEIIMQHAESVRLGEIPVNAMVELINTMQPENVMGARDYCLQVLATIPAR